jgi:hypothetical protein
LLKDYKLIDIRRQFPTRIDTNSILWIYDVFDEEILSKWISGQEPAYIVNDHFNNIEIPGKKIYCVPLWTAKETSRIVLALSSNQSYQTRYTFNFMINKKQINRFLCIKFVELFELTKYDYTWSGVDTKFDLSSMLNELDQLGDRSPLTTQQKSYILSSIQIPPKFIPSAGEKRSESHITYLSNSWVWNHVVNLMFSGSATSLITESLSFQKGTVFTEKTVFALLGKTFPLWVGGGINQAQEFKKMGFDIFDDVIDHSYQHYTTLIERCYYAFERNLHILSDYDYASKIRESMMPRLEHNQQLIKNKQIDYFCRQQINQWPEELQQAIDYRVKMWI